MNKLCIYMNECIFSIDGTCKRQNPNVCVIRAKITAFKTYRTELSEILIENAKDEGVESWESLVCDYKDICYGTIEKCEILNGLKTSRCSRYKRFRNANNK